MRFEEERIIRYYSCDTNEVIFFEISRYFEMEGEKDIKSGDLKINRVSIIREYIRVRMDIKFYIKLLINSGHRIY